MGVGGGYFAEVHGFYAFAAECGTDWWRGRGLSCADYEFYYLFFGGGFARHVCGCCGLEGLLGSVWGGGLRVYLSWTAAEVVVEGMDYVDYEWLRDKAEEVSFDCDGAG